ncbi:5114_t:CDS:2, partial [Gigaspora rosea]
MAKNGLNITSILGTCEIKISKYDYGQLCNKIRSYGHKIQDLEFELSSATRTVTKKRYLRATGAGLRLIGNFDERVRSERQEYTELLRREAKGRTDITLDLGYIHGRPLNVTLDESQLYQNFRPIY